MNKLILLIPVILLLGCTKYIEVERNITVNHTIIINNTIIKEVIKTVTEPCNITCPECEYNREYILRLIREAKKCDASSYYFNLSECEDQLNKTNKRLNECINGFCRYNNSWCNLN